MLLLTMPAAIALLWGLLVLSAYLEDRQAPVLVRFTVRAKTSPEVAEAMVATQLEPFLLHHGLVERPMTSPAISRPRSSRG